MMTVQDMQAERETLLKRIAELEARKNGNGHKPSLKVSEKGGISVYGLGRFPVTLYREQWEKLLGMADEVKAFIAANADKLSVKGDKADAKAA